MVVEPVFTSILDRDDLVSISLGSDRSSSPVEDEPLLVVSWVGVSDSQSVLVSSNVFFPEESSVGRHS